MLSVSVDTGEENSNNIHIKAMTDWYSKVAWVDTAHCLAKTNLLKKKVQEILSQGLLTLHAFRINIWKEVRSPRPLGPTIILLLKKV